MGNKHTAPTIDVRFFTLPESTGDGEAVVRYFSTREKAEAYEDGLDERWGGPCVSEVRLTINLETGKIVGSNKNFDPTH